MKLVDYGYVFIVKKMVTQGSVVIKDTLGIFNDFNIAYNFIADYINLTELKAYSDFSELEKCKERFLTSDEIRIVVFRCYGDTSITLEKLYTNINTSLNCFIDD